MKHGIINTLPQLNSLITNTYILAIIVSMVALALAILVAKLIPFQGGQFDRSHITRRIWIIIFWVASAAFFFLYNNFIVMQKIKNIAFQSKFMTCIFISCIIIIALYGIVGFTIMKLFRKSHFGSILGNN